MLKSITEFIYQDLNIIGKAGNVTLNIAKLFDRFWHASLLSKLKGYGVNGQLFDLIK